MTGYAQWGRLCLLTLFDVSYVFCHENYGSIIKLRTLFLLVRLEHGRQNERRVCESGVRLSYWKYLCSHVSLPQCWCFNCHLFIVKRHTLHKEQTSNPKKQTKIKHSQAIKLLIFDFFPLPAGHGMFLRGPVPLNNATSKQRAALCAGEYTSQRRGECHLYPHTAS